MGKGGKLLTQVTVLHGYIYTTGFSKPRTVCFVYSLPPAATMPSLGFLNLKGLPSMMFINY